MSARIIECRAPSANGLCNRKLRPGERCIDHGVLNPADGSEPQPLKAKPCRCSRPITWRDENEIRCVRCGHVVDGTPKRWRAAKRRSEPRPFVGEQLELAI